MKKLLLLTLFWLCSAVVYAEDLQYGLIHLAATATTEVANDELIVHLQVFEQGKQASKLTELVNIKTARVLDALKNFPEITAKTTNYHTQPHYNRAEIDGWQVTQNILLKTKNFGQMSQLLGDISNLAHIQSMQFQISKQQTDEIQKALTQQAIADFKNKAELVSHEFEDQHYRLVSLSVIEGDFSPAPMMERSMRMDANSFSQSSAPAVLEGGTNKVSVTVNGSIQLYTPAH